MSKGQSKRMSLIESVLNVFLGFVIAVLAQYAIFPFFDVYISFAEHLMMGGAFTVVSIIRSYYIRRFFNFIEVFYDTSRNTR